MKIRMIGGALLAALSLSACQTANQTGEKRWVQIQAGEVWDVADAKCKLWAQQFQQGIYAQGDAGFVIGAQLGNAIGNAIRVQEAYTNCMTIAGWKQVPVVRKPKVITPRKVKAS